jgi:hypothetical protein
LFGQSNSLLFQWLLNVKADINAVDLSNNSAMHMAVIGDGLDVVKLLCAARCRCAWVDCVTIFGGFCLMCALISCH